jgi:C-methyltransferase C-terminal domain/Putative zinc binding domain
LTGPDPRSRSAEAACRSCGHRPLGGVLDLGAHPEANTLPGPDEDASLQPRWPLRAFVCERCWLVQLDGSGPGEAATPGPPAYELSETMRAHAHGFIDDVLARHPSRSDDLRVVELASHGTYLHPFLAERGVRGLIVEGSPPLAEAAARRGYPVLGRPFGLVTAREFVDDGGPADLLIDYYLLAHVSDPDDFVAGLQAILKPGGVAVLEFDHLLPLVADRRFDAFRHGHYSYFGLISARALLERHGLAVFDVEAQPVYGGALRVFVAHAGDQGHRVAPAVDDLTAVERHAGLSRTTTFERFAHGIGDLRAELLAFLQARRSRGEAVVGYGAPSRGSTLLNYCGITRELLAYTVDRSPLKQGRFMPGCGVPIEDPGRIFQTRPAYVLILTWDIGDEVMRQMAAIAEWGGRFVVPLPRFTVLP